MHPHSIIAEELFGPVYTAKFKEIVDGRVSIKHEDWETVKAMLDGKLTKYIQKVLDKEMASKDLANALKTAINSVYGLTSASFDNPFHDSRNKDNIVAKRGALLMINLKHEVQKKGFIVAHIKTDSIKIPDATPEIIQFIMDYGKQYGYTFEHEATYDRMCL
jgi:DNA polymerase elongation subunit (family B)